MKKKSLAALLSLFAVLLLPAMAQTVVDAQKEAVAKYPDLAVEGSPMHTKFLELYHDALQSDPALFSNTDWPLILSDKAYAILAASSPSPSPSASPLPDPPPAPPTPARIVPAPSPPAPGAQGEASGASTISIIKDWVDIIFFLVAGTVVILTFNQARRTIFKPLRTEAFKLQIQAFEEVLLFFEKYPSARIDDEFDLEKIVFLNAMKMLDAYALTFFGNLFRKEEFSKNREGLYKELSGSIVSKDSVEKSFETPIYFQEQAKDLAEEANADPAVKAAKWKTYEHGVIHYTRSCQQALERLRRFHASPLLPKELKALISDFEGLVNADLIKVGVVLTEAARELPVKYPTFAILGKADLRWIWSRYNHASVRLEDKQNAILTYLGQYLRMDDLLGGKEEPRK